MKLASRLQKLTSFPTVTGNIEAADACIAYIKQELKGLPLHVREYRYDGIPAFVATTKKTKSPKLWLVGHIDVVPAGAHLFKPRTAHGRMFGRGVFDMKFAVACYLELFRSLGAGLKDLDLGLMITSDEETGGFHGVKLLMEKAKYRGEVAFLPDGGAPWQFEECAKGKMLVRAYTEGVAAHASRPWHGRNAIEELNRALLDLDERVSRFRAETRDHWRTTCVQTKVLGGEAENMVPAYAEAVLDVRFVRGSHAVQLEKYFASLERRYPNTRFEMLSCEPGYGLQKKNGYARLFSHIAHDLFGITCGWSRSHGSSDARFLSQYGIQTLLILPSAGAAHSEEEWVDLADLERYHAVMREFVLQVAAVEA